MSIRDNTNIDLREMPGPYFAISLRADSELLSTDFPRPENDFHIPLRPAGSESRRHDTGRGAQPGGI